jgi:hypothetical protein
LRALTQDGSSFVSRGLAALTCIYICIALIRNSLFAGLSGDEHQFLASAALAAEGQQPYRDFAYFHMPNLVYVYALFFKLTSYPFLAARLLSGVCASALAILIYFLARKSLAGSGSLLHLLLPTTIAVVLANSPIIADGAQHVWNHTTATLSAVLA